MVQRRKSNPDLEAELEKEKFTDFFRRLSPNIELDMLLAETDDKKNNCDTWITSWSWREQNQQGLRVAWCKRMYTRVGWLKEGLKLTLLIIKLEMKQE